MKGLKKLAKESKHSMTDIGLMLRPGTNSILGYQLINRLTTQGSKKASSISLDDLRALKGIFACSYEDLIDG